MVCKEAMERAVQKKKKKKKEKREKYKNPKPRHKKFTQDFLTGITCAFFYFGMFFIYTWRRILNKGSTLESLSQ